MGVRKLAVPYWKESPSAAAFGQGPEHLLPMKRNASHAADPDHIQDGMCLCDFGDCLLDRGFTVLVVPVRDQDDRVSAFDAS